MAGLLTYVLSECLPIPNPADSDKTGFKKLVTITAAGTVAGLHGIPFSDCSMLIKN
jgi:hypothetical protein